MKSTPARSHKARAKKLGNNQFRQDAQRAHRILTEVRKECNFVDEDEELLFYAFEDGDYIVRGYISKEGNLCFVETLLKELFLCLILLMLHYYRKMLQIMLH